MSYDSTSFALTYTANGVTYNLNGFDSTTGLTIHYTGDGGFGLPTISSITQRGSLQNGDTNYDYRIDPRTISLSLFIQADNYFDHLRIREKISKIFLVANTPTLLTMEYIATQGVVVDDYTREIEVYVRGGLDFGSQDYLDYDVSVSVGLRASTPVWYRPTPNTLGVTQAIVGTPTPIPFLIPTPFGGIALNQTSNVVYDGTTLEYPSFLIVVGSGDILDLEILNVSTNKTIRFPILYAGRTYTINLAYGQKTITSDLGVNSINLLGEGSNFATWALDPNFAGGVNVITVNSLIANSGSLVTMTYYHRYIAV